MTRLFIAIWPPEDVLDGLDDLPRPRDPGVRWVSRENLHITLRFLGDADVDDVSAALDDVELPAGSATLGPAFDALDERSIVLPVDGVDDLADTVRRVTRDIGSQRPRRRFVGHLTVARLRRGARPARSLGGRFVASFEVAEVALVASTLRETGAVYETIDVWPTR